MPRPVTVDLSIALLTWDGAPVARVKRSSVIGIVSPVFVERLGCMGEEMDRGHVLIEYADRSRAYVDLDYVTFLNQPARDVRAVVEG